MLGPELELSLNTPEQNLGNLSFINAKPEAFTKWVADLPMANLGEISRLLYRAISELNRLECSPDKRSQILESLRKPIHYACTELSKHFLNSSVTPHEKQTKIINLVSSMHLQLATGYKIVLMETVPNLGAELARKNFACAAHRVIAELGNVLVLSAQLYMPVPKGLWKDMNEVFRFADDLGLMKYLIHDETNTFEKDTSIKRAYKRNLLIASCRSNQLRQKEIRDAWLLFESWSNYVEVGRKYLQSAVFCINLGDDCAPKHKSLVHDELNDYFYGVDTAELITRITSHLSTIGKTANTNIKHLDIPVSASANLLQHLHHSLGILTKRTFKRISSNGSLDLAVGLSGIHFYTSGKTPFQPLTFGTDDPGTNSLETEAFTRPTGDPWANAFDADSIKAPASMGEDLTVDYTTHSESAEKDFPIHTTLLTNTSPGGYCIQWRDVVPKNVQAGELLCVREHDKKPWSIAVVRWIRNSKQQGTQLGIELLAPRAKPCAVQQLKKTGQHSVFLRGLLLPELTSIGQASTLVTPRLPFKQGNKVSVRFNGTETKCVLSKIVSETGSFSQFVLATTDVLDSKTADLDKAVNKVDIEDEFDSLWPSL